VFSSVGSLSLTCAARRVGRAPGASEAADPKLKVLRANPEERAGGVLGCWDETSAEVTLKLALGVTDGCLDARGFELLTVGDANVNGTGGAAGSVRALKLL